MDCVDSPDNWVDSDGDGCGEYEYNDWCDDYGSYFENMGNAASEVRLAFMIVSRST